MKLKLMRFLDGIRFGRKSHTKIQSVITLQAMNAEDAKTALRLALFEVAAKEKENPKEMINIHRITIGHED